MAVINDPNVAANVAYVGPVSTATTQFPLHISNRPIPHGALGHYRTGVKLTMATTQAANSRLFEIRNTHATNLIIPTRIAVRVMSSGTVTTPYMGEIGLWKLTGFTAVDTTNTVTPTSSAKRSTMAAYPGSAAVRHNTIAGAAAGMTGGTLVKDANQLASLFFNAGTFTTITSQSFFGEFLEGDIYTHPLVLAQNEGFEIENVVVGSGTANVIQVFIDVSWADVVAF
jgi:hypothetical protein